MAREDIVIPDGWVRASMMQGTHTIDEDGKIEPYTVPFKGSLTDIADALIRLGLVQIHQTDKPRFPSKENRNA